MKLRTVLFRVIWLALLASAGAWSQTMLDGVVLDPSGAAVPGAQITLQSTTVDLTRTASSGADGMYVFSSLPPGTYNVAVVAVGFRELHRNGVNLALNAKVRLNLTLELGQTTQAVDVKADASQVNFENAEVSANVNPQLIQSLPLIISGGIRSAGSFVTLLPGVTTGGRGDAADMRVGGGLHMGDEASLDGVSMVEGTVSQSGSISFHNDFPISPDSVSEITVLESNYAPQYGSTLSAQMIATTKSGTNEYHGSLYSYLRNEALNSPQYGSTTPAKDREFDFGGTLGGPLRVPGLKNTPGLWTSHRKTYFFLNVEKYRSVGGVNVPVLTLPTMQERQGDFSDYRDTSGNLIPIFDPATTRANSNYDPSKPNGPNNLPYLRDQFMGCDGQHPNVICPSRLESVNNPHPAAWFKYLPEPNRPGIFNNYVAPQAPSGYFANRDNWDLRVDHMWGDKDNLYVSVHYQLSGPGGSTSNTILPIQITTEAYGVPGYNFYPRLNWDHTFNSHVLNHLSAGYYGPYWHGANSQSQCRNRQYVGDFPKVPGALDYTFTSVFSFDGYQQMGCSSAGWGQIQTRIVNDLVSWNTGTHTFVFGGELRFLENNGVGIGGGSGSLNFSHANTGLLGIVSGNSMASFLLGDVNSGSLNYDTSPDTYSRQRAWSLHFGDTWKPTPRLSINYGVRWEVSLPISEKWDRMSFFDPTGANPGAGGRLGRLTFAGTRWGAASFGRSTPEEPWYGGVGPRLGIAYSLNDKTVLRTGYGIFYNQAFMPGWGSGMAKDGFSNTVSWSSSLGGLDPAFLLTDGFPAIPANQKPPFLDPSLKNGQSPSMYRPFDANRLAYAQQWNFTIERQVTSTLMASVGYVGNKGTRLPSAIAPPNVLDPSNLSLGQKLYDQFAPGQTVLDGVSIPYAGWVEQMTGCVPTVAQALLPYPQYCGNLWGINENVGNSTYNSLQVKIEKRLSNGLYVLTSYTNSKTLTDGSETAQSASWFNLGRISPFDHKRMKSLAITDISQVLSVAAVYDLPFGKGKKFLHQGGIVDRLLGGWQISSIFRVSSGPPFLFTAANCSIPGQFAAACVPSILPGANPWAQDKSSFDPSKPLFNASAFEGSGPEGMGFDLGHGSRVSNLRGFGFHNQDVSFAKSIQLRERVNFQLRGDISNLWNSKLYAMGASMFSGANFDTGVGGANFGMFNGNATNPRNIQIGARLSF
jgi:hypothetical protein